MKILILANLDIGLYKFRKDLIIELIKQGHEVYIALPEGDYISLLKQIGCKFIKVNVDRRGINPKNDIKLIRQYSYIINKLKPNLVITYTIKPNIYGGIAAQLKKTKYVTNITGLGTAFQNNNIVKLIVISMYRFSLRKTNAVFFENDGDRKEFLKYKISTKDKTFTLNGAGVNTEDFGYLPYPHNKTFKFLFIGRVMKEKGIEELLVSMKHLIDDGFNCFLDVVGPFEENYTDLIHKCELEGWLKYYGFQENVKSFINDCDCFVLPSYHEGMANTNLECASSGRPIITSDIPGCRESVIDGSGFLCLPQNADSLYDVMKKMIILSEKQRELMGIIGRNHMMSVFDKKKVVSETVKHLDLRC